MDGVGTVLVFAGVFAREWRDSERQLDRDRVERLFNLWRDCMARAACPDQASRQAYAAELQGTFDRGRRLPV